MPLDIELFERYQLRTKDNNSLELPIIELVVRGSNMPQISGMTVSVSGTPLELAQQIQSVYKNFSSRTLKKLDKALRLKQPECRLDKPLPGNVNCTLQVSVDYFDSEPNGNPNQSETKNIKKECRLWTPLVSEPVPQPPKPVPPTPLLQEEESQTPPSYKKEEKEEISKGLGVPNPNTIELIPHRENQEIDFPGWLAIDFGTSNSTVTLFDPRVVPILDGFPKEQERRLRNRLAKWLNEQPTETFWGGNASEWAFEWEKFISEICKSLDIAATTNIGDKIFAGDNSSQLLEAIRQIEICLSNRSEWFRRAASKRLNSIYHEVFRVPPLEWQSLIEVELDYLRRAREISSELEIVNLGNPLQVIMGERAKQDRNNAIRTDASSSLNQIKGKFHHSPKRYFGQERTIKVILNGKEDAIAVNKLIQSAWAHLIKLTEEFRQRNPGKFAEGRFNTVVVTYPTIAPPVVRREIEHLVHDLGIQDVQIAYDEAVSVAIFFLWREFGGNLNIGIESFKTRCHLHGDEWSQNVLILDIGGGTTDLALISLSLKEINPFAKNEDRGDGGRYYVLTPKLLGSSGHLQLGGELITLRIFQLLKAAIADCLLAAVTSGYLECEVVENRLSELSDRFLDGGKFQSSSLLACVDRENPEGDSAAYKDALDAAEKVLPTRWANAPSRLQTFYTLWEYAEIAKLTLGQKRQPADSPPTFTLSEQQISELLTQSDIKFEIKAPNSLMVTLNYQQFEKAVTPVISEAIGIADGLMSNRLGHKQGDNCDRVDWLILSGKSCNFDLVQRQIKENFSKSKYFVWNPERITFELEYTKLATSAGACYAEKLRRLIFDPENSKDLLRRGANQLYIDVKNLFYFLPCSFNLKAQDSDITIFKAGQELYQIDQNESVAKVRSSQWYGAQLSIIIYRQDFEGRTPQLWGSFNGKALADRLGMNDFDFRNQIKVQFEIDYKLQLQLLFCRENPHYFIAADIPTIDALKAIGTTAIIGDGKVICDIAVNVLESATAMRTDDHTLIFEAGKDYRDSLQVFQYSNGAKGTGLRSAALPPFPRSGKHTFYFKFRNPQTNQWELIGELPQPGGKTEYPCQYYVTLDNKGMLRVHAGELPYWTSDRADCLHQQGCVFWTELEVQPNEVDEKRDPFSGKH